MNKLSSVLYLLLAALVIYFFWGLTEVKWLVHVMAILFGLALILGFRLYLRSKYYDGQIIISEKESGGKLFSLELNSEPEDLEDKTAVSFKIVPTSK